MSAQKLSAMRSQRECGGAVQISNHRAGATTNLQSLCSTFDGRLVRVPAENEVGEQMTLMRGLRRPNEDVAELGTDLGT
jgi:hypothetical protein